MAWLTKVVTNLCLTRLTSARARREQYVGTWLPEPVLSTLGPPELAEQRDTVSYALLVLLEQLTPPERAVFVLREIGLLSRFGGDANVAFAEVNGYPAILGLAGRTLLGVLVPQVEGDLIVGLRIVANPDKLRFAARQAAGR